MIARWTKLENARVLEAGAGIGMYASQIRRRYTPDVECFDIELERSLEASKDTPHALVAAAEAQAFDVQYGLPCDMLHKVDQASMSCSLEVRVPFLDVEAAAGALAMPSTWKVDRGMRKRILVDAYRGRLPDSALDRPKRGFEAPFGELVRGRLLGMFRDVVTRERVEATGMLRYSGVEAVLSSHLNRTGEHGDLLFALLALCWWIHRADRRR